MPEKRRALLWVWVTYVAAFVVAAAVAVILRERSPVERALWADLAATFLVFAASRVAGNSSMYDPYWSVAPPIVIAFWMFAYANRLAISGSDFTELFWALGVLIAVCVWSIRLTANWVRRWRGFDDEDWRYGMLKRQFGRAEIVIDLAGVHLFPTLIVFGAMLPVASALRSEGSSVAVLSTPAIVIGALLVVFAIGLESVADNQLAAFRRDPTNKGMVLRSGVWGVFHHPNYVGEILFWWGLWALSFGGGGALWTISGPLAMTLMFLAVSIPMMNRRLADRTVVASVAKRDRDTSLY